MPDGGEREEKNVLINPGIPIPPAASAVHGISDEDVKGKPTFQQISKSFHQWLSGSDLAGYNSDDYFQRFRIIRRDFGRVFLCLYRIDHSL